ncbi:MAG: hypothetical protein ACHREM_30880, partial [Polyangiales bacterium]
MPNSWTAHSAELMMRYALRTGLIGDRAPRRYLWTDAYAVCNLLGLARATGDGRFADLAVRLVHQVHRVLGRHRPDDRRRGWISGLSDEAGEAHPTCGGLRIGKPLPEHPATGPYDVNLEWDRDGQYFHYLTMWMHALDQVTRSTGRPEFAEWATELAIVARRAFVKGPPGHTHMAWKLSIDLSRPLVASTGQHDPLDGFVACAQLELTEESHVGGPSPSLVAATEDFARLIDRDALTTSDPLGLGGLLFDACRLTQLDRQDDSLIAASLAAA